MGFTLLNNQTSMKIEIELTEEDLKQLVLEHLTSLLNKTIKIEDVIIETKSKQNYKSEWESASYRARVCKQ